MGRRQEDGGPPLLEVQRDGSVQLPAPAAFGLRQFQELRGSFPRCFHGRQRRGDVGQGYFVRAQRGGWRGRQEEVILRFLRCVQFWIRRVCLLSARRNTLCLQP